MLELKFFLILFFVHFSSSYQEVPCNNGSLCLQDYVESKFEAQKFNGTWISDHEIFMVNEDVDFVIYDVRNQSSKLLITAESMVSGHD